jgi:hypothetical protein
MKKILMCNEEGADLFHQESEAVSKTPAKGDADAHLLLLKLLIRITANLFGRKNKIKYL